MDETQNSLYVLQESCPHTESVYLIGSWWVYFALISTENVAVLLYISQTGVPANMVSQDHFYLPPRCNRLHFWAPLGGKLHDEFGQSAFEPIRSVRQSRRRWMISGKLALSHPVKTWSGHDCPPSLAWVSHSYITLLAALHAGSSFTKGPRPSILSRGSSQWYKWLFFPLSGCDGRWKLGGCLKAELCQCWLQLKSLSCFFFFHSLDESELGPMMPDHRGIIKEFDDSGPKSISAFQLFCIITVNYCMFSSFTADFKNVFWLPT